tara:strand:+ start:659 stop:802 length:144 start_codon:yes stop_codon:yes gene_type:complete
MKNFYIDLAGISVLASDQQCSQHHLLELLIPLSPMSHPRVALNVHGI